MNKLKFFYVKYLAVSLHLMIPVGCFLKVSIFLDKCQSVLEVCAKIHPVAFSRDFVTVLCWMCRHRHSAICCYMKDPQLLLALIQIWLYSVSQTHLS